MNNKIISLSKVFLKDEIQNLKIFNKKKNKRIIDSTKFWLIIILAIAISFISYKGIEIFNKLEQPQMFLNIYFIILTMFLQMQIILTSLNALFFSKDLEYILPMPLSGIEIMLAKHITIIAMSYLTELIFVLIPMIIYGLLTHVTLLYFVIMPIVLLIFPIFFVTIIIIIATILMSIFKFIKNKNICQTVVGILLIYIILILEMSTISTHNEDMLRNIKTVGIENTSNVELVQNDGLESKENSDSISQREQEVEKLYSSITKSYVVVNPTINILSKTNDIQNVLINFGKLMLYNIIPFIVLLMIGKKIYLNNVLDCVSATTKKRKNEKSNRLIVKKQKGVGRAYVGQEFKRLLRNSTFFMQLIFPIITIFIVALIIINGIIPVVEQIIQSNDTIKQVVADISFTPKTANIILCIIQVLISIPAISLTAISRDGKDAIFIKYIPISLYKQFIYKNTIQVIVNLIITAIILGMAYIWIPSINVIQALLLFTTSIFISLINSFLMLVVDLKRPQINWNSEYEVTKNSPNKIFQYVFMIVMVLIILYIAKMLSELRITNFLLIEMGIFAIAFIIINLLIKRNIEELFEKII